MSKIVFDGKTMCAYCGGTGCVPVAATILDGTTEEQCDVCGGTGLCDAARIAKLEADVKRLQVLVRRAYQNVPELWTEE